MLREIVLAGELGARYGRVHHLAVNSPAEAVRALLANFKSLKEHFIGAERRGFGYRVIVDRRDVAEKDLALRTRKPSRFIIMPVLLGTKKGGLVNIILGVALIAASFFIPGGWAIGGMAISTMVGSLGASLLLGGLSQMFFAQKTAVPKSEQADSKPSYAFSGPVNTVAQGYPVPIGYGEFIIGSAVISAGQSIEDYPLAAP